MIQIQIPNKKNEIGEHRFWGEKPQNRKSNSESQQRAKSKKNQLKNLKPELGNSKTLHNGIWIENVKTPKFSQIRRNKTQGMKFS